MVENNPSLQSASDPDRKTPPRAPFYGARDQKSAHQIAVWLYLLCALVALMVSVGGATRLTDSGLSITQWDLLMGALPPMSEEKWQEEFTLYQQIPEYERVNKGMSLTDFKSIFWWEWSHRNLGRFIGMIFVVPFVFFWLRGALATPGLKIKLFGAMLLLMGQGLMGWLMVKSGLTERVDVSQYRLAAHLALAFTFFSVLLWMALNLSLSRSSNGWPVLNRWLRYFMMLVSGQIILGAFVAGLRAGKTYNTWPLMDGQFFPAAYFNDPAHIQDMFETYAAVQFNHRLVAYLVAGASVALWAFSRRYGKEVSRRTGWLLMAVTAQILLGIWTLVNAVPISLGLLHQLGALSVLGLCIYLIYWTGASNTSGDKG